MEKKVICNMSDLTSIADAVRASTGSTNTYSVSELSIATVEALSSGGGTSGEAVLYTTQTLTDSQKQIARQNIGIDTAINNIVYQNDNFLYSRVDGSTGTFNYPLVTSTSSGLMSPTMLEKLENAKNVSFTSSLSGGTKIGTITIDGVATDLYCLVTSGDSSNTGEIYYAGTGLSLDNSVFSLATSGVIAGSYGPTADVTGTNNTQINVPYITVDEYGRVTEISNKVYTSRNSTYGLATTSFNGLMSAEDKTKIESIAENATEVSFTRSLTSGTKIGTIIINGNSTDLYCTSGSGSGDTVSFVSSLNSGIKIGTITINGTSTDLYCTGGSSDGTNSGGIYYAGTGLILSSSNTFGLDTSGVTAGTYGPSSAITGTNNTTMNVPEITVDSYGRVTKITNRVYTAKNTTYTIPTSLKNPNALTVVGGSTTCYAYDGSTAKTLTIKAGSNITVTGDTSGNITIANNYSYSLPTATSSVKGGVIVGSNISVSAGTISLTKENVVSALGYTPPSSDTNTTYSAGTGLSLSGTTFSVSTVPVANGGTGSTTAAGARTNLGIPNFSMGTSEPSGGSNGDVYFKYS